LVDTPEGNWYYMAFMDGFPGGRIPILAPITFDPAGWPTVKVDNSASTPMWQREYAAVVNHRHIKPYKTCFRTHCFDKKELEHCWEWNHNPDNSRWRLEEGRLLLVTGTITDNLYLATNTLTHRTIGPKSMATFCVDTVGLIDGDRASVSMFRNQSAYIGIHKDAGVSRLVYVDDLRTSPISIPTGWSNGHPVALDWSVDSNGAMKAETSLTHKRVWLRIKADITPAFSHGLEKETRYSTFEYSYDGTLFTQLGPDFLLTNEAIGFVGYRFAIFNFATKTLGGQLVLEQCDVNSWNESV
jgi:beta-xylosidase